MFSTIRGYLELVLVVLLLSALGTTWYYRTSYQAEHARFESFKLTTKVIGEEAQRKADTKEAEWKTTIEQIEALYAKDTAAHRTRFNRELARLQSVREGDSGSSRVPGATFSPTTCSDKAGNDRLSDGLRNFEIGIIQLLKSAQENTDTLVACQSFVRDIR